jgi:hypothetical protein
LNELNILLYKNVPFVKDIIKKLGNTLNQQNIGAKVTVTLDNGKNVVDAFFTSKNGTYVANSLKADTKPYTVKIDVPGHFTMYKQLVLSDDVRGDTVGKR